MKLTLIYGAFSPAMTTKTSTSFSVNHYLYESNIGNNTLSPAVSEKEDMCKWILYDEIGNSRVRIWDLSILVPNLLFLLFLAIRFDRARLKLRATSSPIFSAFYILVFVNAVISVIRCIVSMTVNAAVFAGDVTDKILWVIVRFFLLSTEMSVLVFGLAFGHLDSSTSIRRVLLVTSFISLAYSSTQGALEIIVPDENFHIAHKHYDIFAHGGMLFWLVSSIVFAAVYFVIFILPRTKLRQRFALPSKRSFYWYALFLTSLNIIQAIGSGLIYYGKIDGICLVDVATYLYFTLYTPLVYSTFLAGFFSVSHPSILFSYKAQIDDVGEDDIVSLPHHLSCSSLKTDSDYIYQNNFLFDNTQFDVNPLYIHSLQSPDSFTGFADSVGDTDNSQPQPTTTITMSSYAKQEQRIPFNC